MSARPLIVLDANILLRTILSARARLSSWLALDFATVPSSAPSKATRGRTMAEKVKKLNLQRDYKQFLYYIDGDGNVCQKPKSGEGEAKVLVPNAVQREGQYLYFIDKDGDVARSARGTRKKDKQSEAA